jgi:tetratricopeptide (TPR) repeat protein
MLIIAATFLVYWPALRNGFVWDDTALVLRDPLIRSWILVPEGFRHFLFLDATASNFYRPIQRLSFVADYQFFGLARPGAWHLTSILIHAGAAVALFFAAGKLLALAAGARLGEAVRERWAFGIAVLWAIHPLHTSAVTYIAGRADPLAALFGFTGLALGLVSLEGTRRAGLWRAGAAACFALALLSKESGGTFLLVWLLVLLWQRPAWRVLVSWAALLAIIVAGYCALRFTAHKTPPPPPPATPMAIRPILAARAFAEYAGLVVAPVSLRMERDVSTKPRDTYPATMQNARLREFQTLGGVLLILGFAAWMRWGWRRAPAAAFCLGAFSLAYLPISNAFSLNATMAEHWLYIPSAFLFLAVAITLIAPGKEERTTNTFGLPAGVRITLAAAASVWVIALGIRTFLRQADWRDQRTFIEKTMAAGGDSPRMRMNLANVESSAGNAAKALELYREALRAAPEQPMIWFGYASVLTRANEVAAAREALRHAETSPLLRAEILQLRATLAMHDRSEEPLPLLREALATAPANWPIRKRYFEYLIAQGDIDRARSELAAFLQEHPYRGESWKLLGQILEKKGDPASARIAFQEAAARDMRDSDSRASALRLAGAGL